MTQLRTLNYSLRSLEFGSWNPYGSLQLPTALFSGNLASVVPVHMWHIKNARNANKYNKIIVLAGLE